MTGLLTALRSWRVGAPTRRNAALGVSAGASWNEVRNTKHEERSASVALSHEERSTKHEERTLTASVIRLVYRHRRFVVVSLHLVLVVLSNFLAFVLRLEGIPEPRHMRPMLEMMPWLVAVRGLLFIPFGLYSGLWRYSGLYDLRNIILAVCSSSALFVAIVYLGAGEFAYPRSVPFIDSILLICFLGGVRLTRRIRRELRRVQREKRVLIFGAGDAGAMIVRDMKNNPFYDCEPIGFVDDDPTKRGERIHGVPVLGGRNDLPEIMALHEPYEVLVAMPKAGPTVTRHIVRSLEPFRVPIKTLPSIQEILDGRVTVSQIRNLSVEDLLFRSPVGLDPSPVARLVEGRRVMVTGAGGSIGSELCRQLATFAPSALTMFERYENSLHAVHEELRRQPLGTQLHPIVGDITDRARLQAVMDEHEPEIVFHAAAHKHVPLMEWNPCEAVRNNVLGSRQVAEAASFAGVERFVLISTDKAVNPTSVMGTTKRVAERIVQGLARRSGTRFVAVRFGNVLNSNGSVVPAFMDQIKAGGPVTVTDPEIRRFFMLIPEAVQLVLHASTLDDEGVVYVLEMGEQIKIVDMARTLIRLAGFVPDEEIPIVFTGLRPGEKLFEELVGEGEAAEPSGIEKILRIRGSDDADWDRFMLEVDELEEAALRRDVGTTLALLRQIVPSFTPSGLGADVAGRPA